MSLCPRIAFGLVVYGLGRGGGRPARRGGEGSIAADCNAAEAPHPAFHGDPDAASPPPESDLNTDRHADPSCHEHADPSSHTDADRNADRNADADPHAVGRRSAGGYFDDVPGRRAAGGYFNDVPGRRAASADGHDPARRRSIGRDSDLRRWGEAGSRGRASGDPAVVARCSGRGPARRCVCRPPAARQVRRTSAGRHHAPDDASAGRQHAPHAASAGRSNASKQSTAGRHHPRYGVTSARRDQGSLR